MSQLRRRTARRRLTYDDSTRQIDGHVYYRIDGEFHVIDGIRHQIYRDTSGNDYFIEDGQVRGIANVLRLPSKAKARWRKLKSHAKKVGLARKEVRKKFNPVLEQIRDSPALRSELRQLSDGPDVDPKELPLAVAQCIDCEPDPNIPIATVVPSGEAKEHEDDQKVVPADDQFVKNVIKSALYEASVVGRATQETMELAASVLNDLNQIAGVITFKTAEGTVIVVKQGGKLVMGLLEASKGPAALIGRTAVAGAQIAGSAAVAGAQIAGSAAVSGAQIAGSAAVSGAKIAGSVAAAGATVAGGAILQLTGTFVNLLFGGGGGGEDPGDSDTDSSSSDDEEEEQPIGRRGAPGPNNNPPRMLAGLQRDPSWKDDGGRRWTQTTGGGRRGGGQKQTNEKRNKKQAAARKARIARARKGLIEPSFKQFVLN